MPRFALWPDQDRLRRGVEDILARAFEGFELPKVDFFDVTYIDTSGLAIMVEVLKAARTQRKQFQLRRLRERPRYLLEATRLPQLFEGAQS